METEIISASLSLFGTADYESVLSVLPAYDGTVRAFRSEVERIRKKYDKERNGE